MANSKRKHDAPLPGVPSHTDKGNMPNTDNTEERPLPGIGGKKTQMLYSQSRQDLRVLQSLRRIIRAVDLHSRKLAADFDVTAPQLVCLIEIGQAGPIASKDLAEQVFLSPSTLVGILDRLEEKKLVERKRNGDDRRVVEVEVTERGRKLVEKAPSPLQDRLAEALKKLPSHKLTALVDSLEKIVSMMEATDIEADPILAAGPLDANASMKPAPER